jgi:hypothetical protein
MTAGLGWTGTQLLVQIAGVPINSPALIATYGGSPGVAEGLKLITAMTGLPTNLIQAPTSRDATITQNRNEEKKKYYGRPVVALTLP